MNVFLASGPLNFDFYCGAIGLTKGECLWLWSLLTTHWLSSHGSFAFAPLCFTIPLCSDRLGWSKSVALLYHWLVPPCYDYSIAHFPPNCNTQNKQSSQKVFVQDAENWVILFFLLQLTWKCAIIKDVVVYPQGGGAQPFFVSWRILSNCLWPFG